MQFEGQQLRELIARTPNKIELRNTYGRCYKTLSSVEALALDHLDDKYIGIGNRRRIIFLRSRREMFALNAGSHTTQRLKGQGEVNIAHPLLRQHRPAWSK
jgi:hypothetical protein